MSRAKYLIYIDILGFEAYAEEIALDKGIDVRQVRARFIDTIKEKINDLEKKQLIIGKKYGNSDDWILILENIENIYLCTLNILDHNTGYEDFEVIPLEIAMGIGEYDKWARYEGTELVVESSTIDFLKTNIINRYKKIYKKYAGQSIKSTFIIMTESLYKDLSRIERDLCKKISYSNEKGKEVTIYNMEIDRFVSHGVVIRFLEKIGSKQSIYRDIEALYVEA